jgi:(p)ppGpp synthase/HD superfamily hydrolase
MTMNQLIEKAKAFAALKHATHVRKYTGVPYFTHLANVAALVAAHGGTPEMVAAAYLHDTLEDTATTYGELVAVFGTRVATLVAEVTDQSTLADGNRAKRKAMDLAHLAKASAAGQTIKLADLIDNGRDIAAHDKGFARVYLREKAALLKVLTKGNPVLMALATATLAASMKKVA